ncbi:MAG: hypothetical protein J7K00_00095 [Candidatus Diapherotrites archaeon]|nr:hypothetical protein [Candidatus Diapherotrites archaeon]
MVEFLSENMAGQIILGTGIFEAIPLDDTLIYGIIFLGLVAIVVGVYFLIRSRNALKGVSDDIWSEINALNIEKNNLDKKMDLIAVSYRDGKISDGQFIEQKNAIAEEKRKIENRIAKKLDDLRDLQTFLDKGSNLDLKQVLTIAELKSGVSKSQEKISSLEKQGLSYKEYISQLEAKIAALEDKGKSELESTHESSKNVLAMQVENDSLSKQVSLLSNQVSVIAKERDSFREKLNEYSELMESYKYKVNESKSAVSSEQSKFAGLQKENKDLQEEIKNISDKNKQLSKEAEKLAEAEGKNKLYQTVIDRYADAVESGESKTSAQMKSLVNPKDKVVATLVARFMSGVEGYKFETEYLKVARGAFDWLRSNIVVVPHDMKSSFWLSLDEVVSKKIGSSEEASILLCSVLKGIGDENAKVVTVLLDDGTRHSFVETTFREKFFIFDLQANDFFEFYGVEETVKKKYNFNGHKIKKYLYEFNDGNYSQL